MFNEASAILTNNLSAKR